MTEQEQQEVNMTEQEQLANSMTELEQLVNSAPPEMTLYAGAVFDEINTRLQDSRNETGVEEHECSKHPIQNKEKLSKLTEKCENLTKSTKFLVDIRQKIGKPTQTSEMINNESFEDMRFKYRLLNVRRNELEKANRKIELERQSEQGAAIGVNDELKAEISTLKSKNDKLK